jgi:hypothetical protein
MIIWRMRIACWVHKAKVTQSENAIFYFFQLQQRLYERPSMLRYIFIAPLAEHRISMAVGSVVRQLQQSFIFNRLFCNITKSDY